MPTTSDLKSAAKHISKRLVAAYALDWIVILIMAGIAAGVSTVAPHYRAFSPLDLSISFPYRQATISTAVLALAAGIIPAIIIFLIVLFLIPTPSSLRTTSRLTLFRLKLWEWNVGWLGLALTLATSQLLVQGMKNVFGKPRPDCLSRCQPDLANIEKYRVGGYGETLGQGTGWILVDQRACMQTDQSVLEDGFRSFPSAHAASSFAGLLFLSLYAAAKFSVWFPLLPYTGSASRPDLLRTDSSVYESAAAAPLWLLFLVYIPIGAAVYITGTRFFEYFHFGFDLISGALIGILSAYLGFRWYQVPLGRSAGRAWAPRSADRAFAVGVGSVGWVDEREEVSAQSKDNGVGDSRDRDIEVGGQDANGSGLSQGHH